MNATQRILIYRLGSLGDTVVALPCFHKIAQTWPDAERIVLTNIPVNSKAAPLEAILRPSGLIHGTIAYPVGMRSLHRLWHLAQRIKELEADVLVYLTPSRGLPIAVRDWLFFKGCGFKQIVGVPLSNDRQRCRRIGPSSRQSVSVEEYEAGRLARCLHALGPIDLDDPRMWDLRLTAGEIDSGDSALSFLPGTRYFAVNMGGKAQEKDWGVRNWRMLLGRLTRQYPKTGLIIVGAAEESERAQMVAEVWSGPVRNLCGALSPRESAAAMRRALAFIGHDSGPLHLAAAAGVRCVGLFGNLNRPCRWHPRGSQHRIIHRMDGLESITVAEVMAAVREITQPHRRDVTRAPVPAPALHRELPHAIELFP